MEISTIAGLIFGFACIVIGIQLDGSIINFVHAPSALIVLGGVIGATAVSYPVSVLKDLLKVMALAFTSKKIDLLRDIAMIIDVSTIARREGIFALDQATTSINDVFLKRGISLIIDGSDPELVRSNMETELEFIRERHSLGQSALLQMSSYSLAFGIIGTIVGFINIVKVPPDMNPLPYIAYAFISLLYGLLLANLIFTPFAKKLEVMSNNEYLHNKVILEGVLSIQDGENPKIIREKLNAFLPRTQGNTQNKQQKNPAGRQQDT